jgi:energy-coupling factor transporter ATP-binding protein EcfA2
MDQIAWDMRYGLPNQTYLEFVTRYLLQLETGKPFVDPFALDVPMRIEDAIYVEREYVQDEICQLSTKIIVGKNGSGKTTLFKRLPGLLESRTLVVRLPLAQIGATVPEQELAEGKTSLLIPNLLVRYIFDAYWGDLLCNSFNRGRFLPRLRQYRQWMNRLCWFYRHYHPLPPEIPEEFELMAWLHTSPSGDEPFNFNASEDVLLDLIHFVTFQPEQYSAPLYQPYARIQILIDGTERPSNLAITRLIQDAERLYNLCLDRVQFKLFVDSAWQKQIEAMDCVRQGRVAVYILPPWSEEELRQVLHRRLTAWGRGEYDSGYDWGKLIPTDYLEPAAQTNFVGTIVGEARKVYTEKEKIDGDGLDAPIHLLRLARGLLAACAGCWREQGYLPPLNYNGIKELARLYWTAGEEKKVNAQFSGS